MEEIDKNKGLIIKEEASSEIKLPAQNGAQLPETMKQELTKANLEVKELNTQLVAAMRSIDLLIKRVAELEKSTYYRFKKFMGHYLNRLRSNFRTGGKKGFFYLFFYYVFNKS